MIIRSSLKAFTISLVFVAFVAVFPGAARNSHDNNLSSHITHPLPQVVLTRLQLHVAVAQCVAVSTACGSGRGLDATTRPLPQAVLTKRSLTVGLLPQLSPLVLRHSSTIARIAAP